jgi:hypothetical protein
MAKPVLNNVYLNTSNREDKTAGTVKGTIKGQTGSVKILPRGK